MNKIVIVDFLCLENRLYCGKVLSRNFLNSINGKNMEERIL